MKKTMLTAILAATLTGATATPALADDDHAQWVIIESISSPIYRMVGLTHWLGWLRF